MNGNTFHPYEPYFWYACLPLTLLLCHYPLCLHFRHPPALICDTNGLSVYNRYGALSGQWYWTEITVARALLHGVSGSSLQLDLTTPGTWPPPGAPPDACPLAAITLTAAPASHSECYTLAIANDHLPRILEQIADYVQHLPPHANIAPTTSDAHHCQWYKHPHAIAKGNFSISLTLVLCTSLASLAIPASGQTASLPGILLLFIPGAPFLLGLGQLVNRTFRHTARPLVRIAPDGLHLALADPGQRNLARLPVRGHFLSGARLANGDINCHIPWQTLRDISSRTRSSGLYHWLEPVQNPVTVGMCAGLGGLRRCKTWQGSPHCLRFAPCIPSQPASLPPRPGILNRF